LDTPAQHLTGRKQCSETGLWHSGLRLICLLPQHGLETGLESATYYEHREFSLKAYFPLALFNTSHFVLESFISDSLSLSDYHIDPNTFLACRN